MKIQDKIRQIINDNYLYEFCGMNFQLFKSDYIMIYNNENDNTPEYQTYFNDINTIPINYLELEYKKEVLIKLPRGYWIGKRHPFAVCFYINSKNKEIEKPISMKVNYI